jgi:hypothetical protein
MKTRAAKPVTDINYWGREVVRPALLSFIATNGKEFVRYYNPTGDVMHFTADPAEAQQSTDVYDARHWAEVANVIYRRAGFVPQAAHIYAE